MRVNLEMSHQRHTTDVCILTHQRKSPSAEWKKDDARLQVVGRPHLHTGPVAVTQAQARWWEGAGGSWGQQPLQAAQ